MTIDEAKKLYRKAVDRTGDWEPGAVWWAEVHDEMERVVAAPDVKAAAAIIEWWDCWKTPRGPLGMATKIRNTWAKMREKKP